MYAGRSVMTALTPSSRHSCSCASVLTVQTWMSRPVRASLAPKAGCLVSWSMPGPRIQPGSSTGLIIGQCRAFSISITSRHVRAPAAAPAAARCRRSSSPGPGCRRRCQPKWRSCSTSRRSTSPPYRVGCLVSIASSTRRSQSATVSSSLRSVSIRSSSVVAVGRLVVEVGPRVLPRGEVELVELGELHVETSPRWLAGPAQVAVVEADQVAVGGEPDVALQPVGAGVERLEVGTEGVLGRASLAPRCATTCGRVDPRLMTALWRVGGTGGGRRAQVASRRAAAARRGRPGCPRSRARRPSTRRCRPGPRVSSSWPKIRCGSRLDRRPRRSRSRATVASRSSTPR